MDSSKHIRKFLIDHKSTHLDDLQNSLLNSDALVKFSKQLGLKIISSPKSDPIKFHELGWLENDSLNETGELLFHPFRIYPILVALNASKLPITPSTSINRESFTEFLIKASKICLPSLEEIAELTQEANDITSLAIILEPLYWPIITSTIQGNLDVSRKYQDLVTLLIQQLDPNEWLKHHVKLRRDASQLDDNRELYLLLRLSPWNKRKKIKGQIACAMWLRHIAEVIRLGFEAFHSVDWPEEDRLYETWFDGMREIVYGTEFPIAEPEKSQPSIAFEFGLNTHSNVRWYLEGETEYYAADFLLSKVSSFGFELINLKGSLGREKANIALRLEDHLVQDKKFKRFSFISFDSDVSANLRTIQKQVAKGNVIGHVNKNDPDFEFANFELNELIEVAAKMDEDEGASSESIKNGNWQDITNAKDFDTKYQELSEIGQKGLKGKKWGHALAMYVEEHPFINQTNTLRPFIQALNFVLRTRIVRYDDQKQNYSINPDNFISEKIHTN